MVFGTHFFKLKKWVIFALCIISISCSPLFADDWDDWGDSSKSTKKIIKRPIVTGWWNWKYNSFSSYDQGRLNLEREFNKGQKFLCGVNVNYYQEDNNKKWDIFPGENYYKFQAGKFDFKLGTLIENIGSGDKISFVDKLNSRRYHNGLENDYNLDKKEVAAIKTSWYLSKKCTLIAHYMPYFSASEFPSIYSKWAYAIHKSLAKEILFNGATYNAEKDSSLTPQYHIEFDTTMQRAEIKLHYMYLKERLPIISQTKPGQFTGTYPLEQTVAMNGNFNVGKDLLFRFETAYSWDKHYSSFKNGKIGKEFTSDQYSFLLGTDKNLPNNFYINIQALMSYIPKLKTQTEFQLDSTEYLGTFQLKQSFKKDKLQIELAGISNFTTGEYIITPKITMLKSDYLTFVIGYHIDGESTNNFGPIGQFGQNDTAFLETKVTF